MYKRILSRRLISSNFIALGEYLASRSEDELRNNTTSNKIPRQFIARYFISF